MNDVRAAFDALAKIVDEAPDWPWPQQLGAFAAAKTLLDDLEHYTRTNDEVDSGYTLENIGQLRTQLRVIFGVDGSGGFDRSQYEAWAIGSCEAIKFGMFREQ